MYWTAEAIGQAISLSWNRDEFVCGSFRISVFSNPDDQMDLLRGEEVVTSARPVGPDRAWLPALGSLMARRQQARGRERGAMLQRSLGVMQVRA